jgi:hypothetical protein
MNGGIEGAIAGKEFISRAKDLDVKQRIRILDFENGDLNVVEIRLEKVEIGEGWGPSVSVSVTEEGTFSDREVPNWGFELKWMSELLLGRNIRRRQFA